VPRGRFHPDSRTGLSMDCTAIVAILPHARATIACCE
jgi:hypothetical protein